MRNVIRDFGYGVLIGLLLSAGFKLIEWVYRNTDQVWIDRDRDYA